MMMHSFLEANLDTLQRLNSPIPGWLADAGDLYTKTDRSMIKNRWGLLDWRLPSGEGLFEGMHPAMCYRDWIPQKKPATSATIIIGCNLGYGLNQVLMNSPDSHRVLLMEPRPEMMAACLTQTDYGPFLKMKKLVLLTPDLDLFHQTVFQQLPLQYEFGNIDFRSDLPSRQLGAEYADMSKRCKGVLEDFSIEMNTFRVHHETMIRNELTNFPRVLQDGSLMHLKNQGKGLTAVMLSAGPSLERFAPVLAEHPGEALYVSAFQTLPALQGAGMKPHVSMVIDFTQSMMGVLDRIDRSWARDIPLIYSCKALPELIEKYPGPTLPLWTVGGLGSQLWRDSELVLNTGRNVGVALLRFLAWCGIDRMLMVGQDFAWSGDKTHSSGHMAADHTFRFDPDHHVKLKNKFGETIYSDSVYLTALKTLETELAASNVTAFNMYGGHAVIKGTTEVKEEDLLEGKLLRSEPGSLNRFVGLLKPHQKTDSSPRFEAKSLEWSASLRSAQKRLEKLFKKPDTHQQEIRTALHHLLVFIGQDTVYQPYLIPEIRSLSGLMFGKPKFGLKDMAHCRQVLKRVMRKVREMDRVLAPVPN